MGQKNLSTIRSSDVSIFGRILNYCINRASIGTMSSGRVSEVAAIGRCLVKGGSTVGSL